MIIVEWISFWNSLNWKNGTNMFRVRRCKNVGVNIFSTLLANHEILIFFPKMNFDFIDFKRTCFFNDFTNEISFSLLSYCFYLFSYCLSLCASIYHSLFLYFSVLFIGFWLYCQFFLLLLVTALSMYVYWTFFSTSFSVSLSFFFSFYLLLFQLFPFLLSFPIVLLDCQSNSSQSFEPLNGSAKQFSEFKCKNSPPSVSNSFTLSFCEYVFHLFFTFLRDFSFYQTIPLCTSLYFFPLNTSLNPNSSQFLFFFFSLLFLNIPRY